MKVAVLGCGPAGLMAAHAAVHAGAQVAIFSRKVKSDLYGAQYLHEPIPGATNSSPITVDYRLDGTPDGYRRKVYGQMWDGTVSPEDLGTPHLAWDIRGTYTNLWALYNESINDGDIDAGVLRQIVESNDLVVSSIPKPRLCHREHLFGSVNIVAAGDAPDIGINVGTMYQTPENTVICNGHEVPFWYRKSRIFGYTTVEWPMTDEFRKVPVKTAAAVRKPTDNNCDCWPEILHVGRYGTWAKGVLSHTAYWNTWDEIGRVKK